VFLVVLFADQGTKFFLNHLLPQGMVLELIPGLLALVNVQNPGVAFGLFAEYGALVRYLFSVVNLVAAVILFWIARRSSVRVATACGLIAGGAVGNLVDRLLKGKVSDFIDLHLGPYHWPAFNMADSAITIGVLLLLFFSFRDY
jgi:signal peptidase II